MTYTTNYSLHKPDTTDNFNVGDFNANSDIIDKQFGITSANIPKVTCSTSASTVAKTATINGTFVLNRGARVLVVLSTANTVASATFNLNSTGAKPILVNGASVTTSNLTAQTYLAEYDGTNWRFTTSTYTSDYARTSNSAGTAVSVTDYANAHKTIKIGYAGPSLTTSEVVSIAGYKTGGEQIKDVNKATLTSWLGLSNYLPLSGGTVTGATQFNNYVKLNAWSNHGTGTANFWYDGNNKFVEIENATDLKLSGVKVSKEGHKHSASDITSVWYGTCSTASATVAKTVSITDFSLTTNVCVTIKFTNSNTATNATLNINSTGAKAIYYHGTNVPNNIIVANSTINLVYNGTQYEIVGDFSASGSSMVTGVKGEAESTYRSGNVNITKSNLGLTTDEMGIKWSDSNITSGSDRYKKPYYANGIWVIGSYDDSGIKYSTDGKTWTNSNITSGAYNSPYYANGIWVIGTIGIKYSTDGKTWSNSNITSGVFRYNSPYYANGIWVIGSEASGIKYSTDGKTWSNSNITNDTCYAPYYANGIWVIGSINGIKYSTDGKTWTTSNITTTHYAPYYANGIWVIDSYASGIKYSTDGKTWSNSNITSGRYDKPYYANGIWVIGGTHGIKYSTDGKTWSNSNITSGAYNSPYYANGIWVIGSEASGVKYSTFNSLNDLGSAFKGISELKSYTDKGISEGISELKSYTDDTFATKSYVNNHKLFL